MEMDRLAQKSSRHYFSYSWWSSAILCSSLCSQRSFFVTSTMIKKRRKNKTKRKMFLRSHYLREYSAKRHVKALLKPLKRHLMDEESSKRSRQMKMTIWRKKWQWLSKCKSEVLMLLQVLRLMRSVMSKKTKLRRIKNSEKSLHWSITIWNLLPNKKSSKGLLL